jgi:hypothetical protein
MNQGNRNIVKPRSLLGLLMKLLVELGTIAKKDMLDFFERSASREQRHL